MNAQLQTVPAPSEMPLTAPKRRARGSIRLDPVNDSGTPYPPRRTRNKLDSITGCARELAAVYRSMKSGAIDPAVGSRLAYVITAIARTLESGDLERRIEMLEADS